MENNQPKKKNAGLTALIALLLVITTIASCIGIYAWARYRSSQSGDATAQIAKWNFNVSLHKGDGTVALGSGPIDLSTTAAHVADGRIAPGTSGTFDIEINTTGTEVDLQYDVTLALENCPRNITFSRKTGESGGQDVFTPISAGGASNTSLTRTGITFSEYVAHDAQNRVITERIKWEWPYDAGQGATAAEQEAYDTRDNDDEQAINGTNPKKLVTMNITVTGTEVLYNPNASAAETPGTAAYAATHASTSGMARWQSVNYTPGTASIGNDTLSIAGASLIGNTKVASIAGASIDGTISTADAGDWVILDFDETTGEVKIIPRTYSSTYLTLSGMEGYNNAITALDTVAGIYKNDTYASSSRSLTVEDVNAVEGYDPAEVASGSASASASASGNGTITRSWDHRYGMDANLNIVDYGEGNVEERTYVRIPETGHYSYETSNFNTNWGTGSCWLASRCVYLYSNYCGFYVRYLYGGDVNYGNLFNVSNYGNAYDRSDSGSYPVVPVVTLKSTVKMDKDNNGVWQLSL